MIIYKSKLRVMFHLGDGTVKEEVWEEEADEQEIRGVRKISYEIILSNFFYFYFIEKILS